MAAISSGFSADVQQYLETFASFYFRDTPLQKQWVKLENHIDAADGQIFDCTVFAKEWEVLCVNIAHCPSNEKFIYQVLMALVSFMKCIQKVFIPKLKSLENEIVRKSITEVVNKPWKHLLMVMATLIEKYQHNWEINECAINVIDIILAFVNTGGFSPEFKEHFFDDKAINGKCVRALLQYDVHHRTYTHLNTLSFMIKSYPGVAEELNVWRYQATDKVPLSALQCLLPLLQSKPEIDTESTVQFEEACRFIYRMLVHQDQYIADPCHAEIIAELCNWFRVAIDYRWHVCSTFVSAWKIVERLCFQKGITHKNNLGIFVRFIENEEGEEGDEPDHVVHQLLGNIGLESLFNDPSDFKYCRNICRVQLHILAALADDEENFKDVMHYNVAGVVNACWDRSKQDVVERETLDKAFAKFQTHITDILSRRVTAKRQKLASEDSDYGT